MMRVTVEIMPGGDERRKKTIATINLANTTGLAEKSDYEVWGHEETLGTFRTTITEHERALGWMPLVRRTVQKLFASLGTTRPTVVRGVDK